MTNKKHKLNQKQKEKFLLHIQNFIHKYKNKLARILVINLTEDGKPYRPELVDKKGKPIWNPPRIQIVFDFLFHKKIIKSKKKRKK